MDFLVLGLNHKSAPLEVREKISFSSSKIIDALQSLQAYPFIQEGLILSTCNRVEIYAWVENKIGGLNSLKQFIYNYHNLGESLEEYFYLYENQQAIEHIFRVASSLDSMIVGENQILNQVKQAFGQAQTYASLGKFLSAIFQEALRVGKKVRTETNISKGTVSISSAAVELAKKKLRNLEAKKILIIGAGKIGELTTKALANKGIKLILVANRTFNKAIDLAEVFGGRAIKFDQLKRVLVEVDIVISSTSAPHYILKNKDIALAAKARAGKPLFLIDLGVPRNIEQSIFEIKDVYLYNIDDLNKISELNLQRRSKEAYRAEEIVKEKAKYFYNKVGEICLYEYESIPA